MNLSAYKEAHQKEELAAQERAGRFSLSSCEGCGGRTEAPGFHCYRCRMDESQRFRKVDITVLPFEGEPTPPFNDWPYTFLLD